MCTLAFGESLGKAHTSTGTWLPPRTERLLRSRDCSLAVSLAVSNAEGSFAGRSMSSS